MAPLNGRKVSNWFMLAVLRSPLGTRIHGMCELGFHGRMSGRTIRIPVQCARQGDCLVIYVGRSGRKKWWRNFVETRDVSVRLSGTTRLGQGRTVWSADPDRDQAERIYGRQFRSARIDSADPMLVIRLDPDEKA